MSIPVAIDDLVAATAAYGWAYLVTVRDDHTPHIVAVRPEWSDGVATMDVGRSTRHNIDARPQVTLTYPPLDADGYSLIVDGRAEPAGSSDDASSVTFAPTGAVLHRPAAPGAAGGVTGCVNDCAPIPHVT